MTNDSDLAHLGPPGVPGLARVAAHLRPRFADRWLPARFEPVMVRLQEALMAAFCLVFAVVAMDVVVESWELRERSTVLRTLIWPVQLAIPLVFAMATVRHGAFALFPALRPADGARGDGESPGRAV